MAINYLDLFKWMIKAYIYFTLFHFLLSKVKNKLLLYIILLNTFIIFLCDVLIHYKISIESIGNIYALAHPLLWFWLLGKTVNTLKIVYFLAAIFFIAIGTSFYLGDDGVRFLKFNTSYFVIGSLIYVAGFIWVSFLQLQKENIALFLSNSYLLICSPVLFFIGISFIYGFENSTLDNTILFLNFKLYNVVNLSTNIIFYSLINLYISKERRLKNVY